MKNFLICILLVALGIGLSRLWRNEDFSARVSQTVESVKGKVVGDALDSPLPSAPMATAISDEELLAWEKRKPEVERKVRTMGDLYSMIVGGGYKYDRSLADKTGKLVSDLAQKVAADDVAAIDAHLERADEMVRRLRAASRWQAGLEHPRFKHVKSSYKEGMWTADEGYVFVFPNTPDMTVRYQGRKVTCRTCSGRGQVQKTVRCGGCGGSGQVANGFAIGVNAALGALPQRGRRGFPRGGANLPTRCPCGGCNGTGRVIQQMTCTVCSGSGSCFVK